MRILVLLVLSLVVLLPQVANSTVDIIEEPGKQWELSTSIGYKMFSDKEIQDSTSVALRLQKRLVYPFLIGVGVDGTLIGDVAYIAASAPMSARLGLGPVKMDAIIAPGLGYAENTSYKIKKLVGVGTAGLELKWFFTKGISAGVGVYYSVLTYTKMNHITTSINFSF